MRALCLSIVAVLTACAASLAAQAEPPALAVRRQQLNAATHKADRVATERFLTNDLVWTDRAGRTVDRSDRLRELKPGNWTPAEIELAVVHPDSAIVLGRSSSDPPATLFQVWTLRGEWYLTSSQTVQAGVAEPVTTPSSAYPAEVGGAEVEAVRQAIERLSSGSGPDLVTSDFVGVAPDGTVTREVRAVRAGLEGATSSSSVRIHGTTAVVNRLQTGRGTRERQTLVLVQRQAGWFLAGMARTPVRAQFEARHPVEGLERQLESAFQRGDAAFLTRTLAEDFLFSNASGEVNGKAAILTGFARPGSFLDRQITAVLVEEHGDVALTTGRIEIRSWRPREYTVCYTRLWQRSPDGWRLISHRTYREADGFAEQCLPR